MAGSFTVGDFRTSGAPEPRKKAAKAAPPAVAETEAPAPAEVEIPKTAVELYKERLAAAGISEAEASSVFDDLITDGYYQETVSIRGKELVLRTRTYADHARTLNAVELHGPKFQVTQEEIQARHNLAGSLVAWNGTVYKKGGDPDKEFQDTLEAVKRFPVPLYSLMLNALVKFDARMYVIFSDGAAESF